MVRRFFEQAWLYYKGQNTGFNFEEFVCLKLAIPILTLIMYCIMASYGFQTDNLTYWVIGNSFLLCTNTCVFSLGSSFYGERYYGRLRSLIVSPCSKFITILQKGFFPLIEAVISVTTGFLIGSLIFGIRFSEVNLVFFLIIILTAMVSACGFGMILGIIGMVTSEMQLLLNCMAYVFAILSGANFSVFMLPKGVQYISNVLPLTRSIRAANLLFAGEGADKIIPLLLWELGIGAIYFIISVVILKAVERAAIKKATLEVF